MKPDNKLTHTSNKIDMSNVYIPLHFILSTTDDRSKFYELLDNNDRIETIDEIDGQLRELIKIRHPEKNIKDEEYPALIEQHLSGTALSEYGVWVFYPWLNKIVHLLNEDEFVEVRTNRNRYKLTKDEQELLSSKTIGIIGLSVGQSIALTIAMERICGEIRLADFDTVELSNLNRIRTAVYNLGLKKTIIAAREIYEIDPFLKVRLYNDGINKENIDDFLAKGKKLDMLVEVCDGLDIKIISRFKARELRIPVLMDTNDRGMLDVERFDLEPDRPILHGLAGDLDPEKTQHLTNEQKIPYILKMIGAHNISTRLKASMMEVEQSINTWPQLASSVVLGGALTTDTARRILLGQFHESGRYYVDFDELLPEKSTVTDYKADYEQNCPQELSEQDLHSIAERYKSPDPTIDIGHDLMIKIVRAACAAPSGGNAQPWKFLWRDNRLFIFHDIYFSYSLLDFDRLGSYIAFGAMLENIAIQASELDLEVTEDILPLKDDDRLVAVISFSANVNKHPFMHLSSAIHTRVTSRELTDRKILASEHKHLLISTALSMPGAQLFFYESQEQINAFADILTNVEKLRILNPRGHYDTFIRELRFTQESVSATGDGLDIETLNMPESNKAALKIASDPGAIRFLHSLEKGAGLKKISEKPIKCASSICVLAMNGNKRLDFLQGGRIMQRIWLEANSKGLSLQPVTQVIFLLQRYEQSGKKDFNDFEMHEFAVMKKRFDELINLPEGMYPVFVFRLFYSDEPKVRSLRRSLDKVLFIA